MFVCCVLVEYLPCTIFSTVKRSNGFQESEITIILFCLWFFVIIILPLCNATLSLIFLLLLLFLFIFVAYYSLCFGEICLNIYFYTQIVWVNKFITSLFSSLLLIESRFSLFLFFYFEEIASKVECKYFFFFFQIVKMIR